MQLPDMSHGINETNEGWREAYASFNQDQLHAFNAIDEAVENKMNTLFFLNAVGELGKDSYLMPYCPNGSLQEKMLHLLPLQGLLHFYCKVRRQLILHSKCHCKSCLTQRALLLQDHKQEKYYFSQK